MNQGLLVAKEKSAVIAWGEKYGETDNTEYVIERLEEGEKYSIVVVAVNEAGEGLASEPSKGEPIADLLEDLAAEQKARATYENLINLADDPDGIDPLRFLREREIFHFQRFGEVLQKVREYMESKKYF